ncbi:MAG TPA: serine hydrolase domain-containing protein, partial [Pilimelia sp.]|nr:serine hydrolase domain-containing protein [Pilimelia sp.]
MTAALTRLPAAQQLRETLNALVREQGLPGGQLVVHHAGETVAVCAGVAEYGTPRPVTDDTAFPVGSITKSFTATMAMILLADGDLELDAPVGLHVPGLGELGSALTVRHLLSHTGGLACGPASAEVRELSPRRYVTEHCHPENLVLPPGTGFSYSNLGYALAGLLIEEITGMSWAEAVESIVLRPLGIAPAFVHAPGDRAMATGHSVNLLAERVRPVQQSLAPAEAPAGALVMSAGDLASLGLLHVGGGRPAILPRYYADLMRRPVAEAEPFGLADGWGLGLARFHAGEHRWVGHDGNADGTACYLRIEPDAGWVVAFTCN